MKKSVLVLSEQIMDLSKANQISNAVQKAVTSWLTNQLNTTHK